MALTVGSKAPKFALLNQKGEKVSLSQFKGKTVVLYFYPKDLTSGCTTEACDFNTLRPKFSKRDAVILGVSKDPVERHLKFAQKYDLGFDLLADVDGEVCQAYGVWKEKSMYGRKFMGIERSTFVISPTGEIQEIYSKVKVTDHAETVLDALAK